MHVSETVKQWLMMYEKCSAVWVLGLAFVGTVALVQLPHPGCQDVSKQLCSAWFFSCGHFISASLGISQVKKISQI